MHLHPAVVPAHPKHTRHAAQIRQLGPGSNAEANASAASVAVHQLHRRSFSGDLPVQQHGHPIPQPLRLIHESG
jgi:hypothetical protein